MANGDEELAAGDIAILAEREARHQARLELFATLEKRIGIPKGFFWSLRNEEDACPSCQKRSVARTLQ
jgi:hypothetical protein